jgi:hypothetical protein
VEAGALQTVLHRPSVSSHSSSSLTFGLPNTPHLEAASWQFGMILRLYFDAVPGERRGFARLKIRVRRISIEGDKHGPVQSVRSKLARSMQLFRYPVH